MPHPSGCARPWALLLRPRRAAPNGCPWPAESAGGPRATAVNAVERPPCFDVPFCACDACHVTFTTAAAGPVVGQGDLEGATWPRQCTRRGPGGGVPGLRRCQLKVGAGAARAREYFLKLRAGAQETFVTGAWQTVPPRSEEHTSELQSL